MRPKYFSALMGGLIYMSGDTLAALITDEFSLVRSFGIFIIGATIYAYEIPRYFRWIEKKMLEYTGRFKLWLKTMMALLYFNPLWIARHLLFVYFVSAKFDEITFGLLWVGLISFAVNIPLSILANYLIQNKISFRYRFFSSAVFSGLMAIYYSMSSVWF